MNVYDSDKMKDIFLSHNIKQTDDFQNADYVVLNTCHIREKATEKTFSDLGKIHKKGKEDQKVIVAGCVAQAEGELIQKRAPYVDLVIGPQSIQSLNKFLDKNNLPKTSITEFDVNEKFDTLNHIKTNTSNKSAFVTIQAISYFDHWHHGSYSPLGPFIGIIVGLICLLIALMQMLKRLRDMGKPVAGGVCLKVEM